MWARDVIKNRFFFLFLMMCLSLYDYQDKVSRYRKGLTYLKKQGNHKSKPNTTFTKTEKKILKHKINGNHPTKQGKEEKRNIESTGK